MLILSPEQWQQLNETNAVAYSCDADDQPVGTTDSQKARAYNGATADARARGDQRAARMFARQSAKYRKRLVSTGRLSREKRTREGRPGPGRRTHRRASC